MFIKEGFMNFINLVFNGVINGIIIKLMGIKEEY